MTESYEHMNKGAMSHRHLAQYITMWFDKAIKQRECAFILMDILKNSKYGMLKGCELLQLSEYKRVTFYESIKKLKALGVIRREGHYYKLDSQFSLNLLRVSADFIQYAEVKSEKQKEELVKMVMGL